MYTYELYNSLPSLREAREHLFSLDGGPDPLLKYLGPLFKKYPQFGICLIHAHCKLGSGERMVSTGRISEPKIVSDESCFPERWLSSGDPFEFSSSPTVKGGSVPKELLDGFQARLRSFSPNDLSGLLGIYWIHDPDSDDSKTGYDQSKVPNKDIIWLETTEGRTNILEPITKDKAMGMSNGVPAAWYVSCRDNPDDPDSEGEIIISLGCNCADTGGHSLGAKALTQTDPSAKDSSENVDCHVMKKRVLVPVVLGTVS